MAKIIVSLISLTALISLIINFGFIQKTNDNNRVVEVVDGDTFQLKSKERVRLMGVDAPEFDRCYGQEAKQRLTQLILNKTVELKEPVTEKYGRTMALVYQNGTLINKTMMEEGFARPDYRKNSQRDILTAAYQQAENTKIGLWNSCISKVASNSCLIKGNIDFGTYEKFYHLPGCRQYNQTILNLAFGEKWFCSESEAQQAGFTKSKGCN
ncbi:MAG: thermonuclease family protein [bacterium]|nr:thermonuclease family protein [bacterium]